MKKHKEKAGYEGMYSVAKHVYMADGNLNSTGFTIDMENLRILKDKIDAMLIDDDKDKPSSK